MDDQGRWEERRHGAVAVLTYHRPPRNLMTFAAMAELGRRAADLGEADDVNVVVVTGGVPGYFVGHAELADLVAQIEGRTPSGDPHAWYRTFRTLGTIPQPVVSAVNGQAWGGGTELALASTIRLAARSATFSAIEVDLGIIPGAGGTQRLPRVVGLGRAAELVLTGRVVTAAEALAIGLVSDVLEDEAFLDHALAWVERRLAKPRSALAAAKRALFDAAQLPLEEGLRAEGRAYAEVARTPAARERLRAALQRYEAAGPSERVDF